LEYFDVRGWMSFATLDQHVQECQAFTHCIKFRFVERFRKCCENPKIIYLEIRKRFKHEIRKKITAELFQRTDHRAKWSTMLILRNSKETPKTFVNFLMWFDQPLNFLKIYITISLEYFWWNNLISAAESFATSLDNSNL